MNYKKRYNTVRSKEVLKREDMERNEMLLGQLIIIGIMFTVIVIERVFRKENRCRTNYMICIKASLITSIGEYGVCRLNVLSIIVWMIGMAVLINTEVEWERNDYID